MQSCNPFQTSSSRQRITRIHGVCNEKVRIDAFLLGGLALLAVGCGGEQQSDETAGETPSGEMETETGETESMQTETPEGEASGGESEGETMAGPEPYNGSDMKTFSNVEELLGMYEWQDFGEGIKYIDVREGSGDVVEPGNTITAYYTLWNPDGKMNQSNVGSDPFSTQVGVGRLIQGWDKAVPGMKVGGVRRLVIPGELAYGENPPPGIPPNATLVFELMIVSTSK